MKIPGTKNEGPGQLWILFGGIAPPPLDGGPGDLTGDTRVPVPLYHVKPRNMSAM